MDLDDFPIVKVDRAGTYRLIAEEQLDKLLRAHRVALIGASTVGDLVRQFRRTIKASQSELAARITIPGEIIQQKKIDNIENGRTKKLSLELRNQLISIFGVEFSVKLELLESLSSRADTLE